MRGKKANKRSKRRQGKSHSLPFFFFANVRRALYVWQVSLLYERLQSTRNLKYTECANRKHFYIIFVWFCVFCFCATRLRFCGVYYVRAGIRKKLSNTCWSRVYAYTVFNMGLSLYRLMMIYSVQLFGCCCCRYIRLYIILRLPLHSSSLFCFLLFIYA